MNQKIHEILHKIKGVVLGYPVVLAMSLTMALTIVLQIENDWNLKDSFVPIKIIITSALGISLMFAVKMLSQRIGKELLLQLAGIAFLVGFYFILPDSQDDFSEVYVYIILPTFILSHLLAACIAFLGHQPEISFWQYNKNLFVNLFLTVVFTGVLTAGVELAILAVQELFGVDFEERIYAETFFMLAVFGSTFIFLLFNEKGLAYLEQDSSYPVILKFFTQFILIPLLLIYVVILYFYSAKILLNWELPQGWVSYLVLAYSILGIFALLLVHPLKGDSTKSWVKIFSRVFYFSVLPLIILLFVAIFTRVLQYGYTEPRYFVLLLAVWLLTVVLYFIFRKNPTIKFIPVSLFLFGLFALLFPYLNTFSVAKRSQKNQLEKVLTENKLLENGKINFEKKIPGDIAENISDKFKFLSERSQYDYLSTFLREETKSAFKNDKTWYINILFKNVTDASKNKLTNLRLISKLKYSSISDYDYAMQENDLLDDGIKLNDDHFELKKSMYGDNPVYELEINSDEKVDLMPMVKILFDKHHMLNGEIEVDALFVEKDIGKYHIKIIFSDIQKSNFHSGVNYYFSNALFLIREN